MAIAEYHRPVRTQRMLDVARDAERARIAHEKMLDGKRRVKAERSHTERMLARMEAERRAKHDTDPDVQRYRLERDRALLRGARVLSPPSVFHHEVFE